mgnify:CR=1 FL=1
MSHTDRRKKGDFQRAVLRAAYRSPQQRRRRAVVGPADAGDVRRQPASSGGRGGGGAGIRQPQRQADRRKVRMLPSGNIAPLSRVTVLPRLHIAGGANRRGHPQPGRQAVCARASIYRPFSKRYKSIYFKLLDRYSHVILDVFQYRFVGAA